MSIKNCNVQSLTDENISITGGQNAGKGGIVALANTKYIIDIENCNVDKVNVYINSNSSVGSQAISSAGIIGGIPYNTSRSGRVTKQVVISKCSVTNSTIKATTKEASGIIGFTQNYSETDIAHDYISDCIVKNCTIESAGYSAAGIFAETYSNSSIALVLSNCMVDECTITGMHNVAGIFGNTYGYNDYTFEYCTVINSTITNRSAGDPSATFSNINTGGIVGNAMSNMSGGYEVNIINSNCINNNITVYYGNVGGILGHTWDNSSKPTLIKNCNVVDGSIIKTIAPSLSAGGIAGGIYGYAQIENCKVLNANIDATANNVGGIIGYNYCGGSKFSNLYVYETIINGVQNSSYGCIGGIAGLAYGERGSSFSNLTVDNCEITSNLPNTSGGIGYTYLATLFTDINVTNTNITSTCEGASQGAVTAGIICASGSLNTVENLNVENVNIQSKSQNVAGAIGTGTGKNFTAKNCNVKNVILNNEAVASSQYKTTAGFIGSDANSNTSLYNIKVEDIEISGAAGSQGGIFGYINNLIIIDSCTVNNVNITDNAIVTETRTGRSAGGLGSYIGINSGEIKNCTVSDSSIITTTDRDYIGELIGYICTSENGRITGCEVNNMIIENEGTNSSPKSLGGLIGRTPDIEIIDTEVLNSMVKQNNATDSYAHIGGVIGYGAGDVTIGSETENGIRVYNTEVINNRFGYTTGGIVGMMDYGSVTRTLNISNSSVENCKNIIGNGHVGGILGFGKIISNNNIVKNTNITSKLHERYMFTGDVGGIVGNCVVESEINNVTVENTKINGNISVPIYNQKVGGIVGMSKAIITNAHVTENSIISSLGVLAETGGIAGHSSYEEGVKATECTVEDSIIQGNKGIIGGIFGFSNVSTETCDVINTNIKDSI